MDGFLTTTGIAGTDVSRVLCFQEPVTEPSTSKSGKKHEEMTGYVAYIKTLTAQVEQEAKVGEDAEGGAHVNECDSAADDYDSGGIGDQMLDTNGDSNLSPADFSRSLSSTGGSFVHHVSYTGGVNVDQDERDVGAGSPHKGSGPGSCTSDETEDTMLLALPLVTRSGTETDWCAQERLRR